MSTPSDETSLAETGAPRTAGSSSRSGWLSSGASHPEERIPLGTILSERYRVIGLLGRGGMGEVYRTDDLRLGQQVALKFLPDAVRDDPQRLAQFHNEVRVARQVSHRNVCRVYDIGEADGRIFLTMEYVDGEDLSSLLKRIGRFPQEKGTEIARQICAGLAAAHDLGVLHRDLKPANIMLDGEGRVRITDFGLAGVAGEIKDLRSGTPAYMAPEQLAGREVSVRSDLFALGLVLYEIVTGRRAFEAKTVAELLRMHDEGLQLSLSTTVKDLDPAIERVIERCLKADPRARPASAIAVSAALPGGDPLAAALAAGETPSPEMVAAAGRTEAVPVALALGSLVTFLVLLATLLFVRGDVSVARYVPLDLPLDVLADRARGHLARFGYTETPADAGGALFSSGDYPSWVRRTRTGADRWTELASGRTPTVGYWYRTSPRLLVPLSTDQHRPDTNDPPLVLTGMTLTLVDVRGHLLEFHRIPEQREASPPDPAAPIRAPDWQQVFDAVAWPRDRFTPATPQWTPRGYADARMAWTGTIPELGDTPLRLEAAGFRGRLTYVSTLGPWSRPSRMEAAPVDRTQRVLAVATGALVLCLLAAATLLARRNFVLGRGDRVAALRVSLFVFVTSLAASLFNARHVFDFQVEQGRFFQAVADAAFPSLLFWIAYMALEPWVRRHWPSSLISWTRLLANGPRDPLVGRDVLVGLIFGGLMAVFTATMRYVPGWLGEPPSGPLINGLYFISGVPLVIAAVLRGLGNGLLNGVLVPLIYVALRKLLRVRAAAAVALVLVFSLFVGAEGSFTTYPWLTVTLVLGISTLALAPLLRFGLLPFMVANYTANLLQSHPITPDLSAWYATPTILIVGWLVLLAGYAFVQARSGQPLLGMALEE